MKRLLTYLIILFLLSSHDMYLKLETFFLEPESKAIIQLFNGTFDSSDNVIDRDRMLDVSLVANGKRSEVDTASWFEKETTTYLNFTTASPGTYVVGVSTKPRSLGMSGESFNDYLEHDGVLDMLALREANGTLADSAVERYSKHVKTVFQVGNDLTDDYKVELGYPIEFIPLSNPYDIHPGHNMSVKLLFNQEPLVNQLIYVGSQTTAIEHAHDGEAHSHASDTTHTHDELQQFRTDETGQLVVPIRSEGVYYLRTIHLVESNEEGLTHESNWATLTFAVGSGHAHEHSSEHGSENGIPTYIYFIVGLFLIVVLYLLFKRKN